MSPVNPATIAAGGQLLGGVMGFKGSRAAAKAQRQIDNYNIEVAKNEQILNERARRDQESNLRNQANRLVSSQIAATAASGIQLSGSPLRAMADTYYSLEKDVARVQYASEIEQTQTKAQIELIGMEGRARRSASNYQAYASLLGGATTAYGTYYELGKG